MTRRHHITSKDGNSRDSRRKQAIADKRAELAQGRAVVKESWRAYKTTAHERGYTYQWQQSSKLFLEHNPLCKLCLQRGVVSAATLVDHVIPHKGDMTLFWCVDNWQALCNDCHNTEKKEIETLGFSTSVGLDGWPMDARHPVNIKANGLKNHDNLSVSDDGRHGGLEKVNG